jgi:hypothetical protein
MIRAGTRVGMGASSCPEERAKKEGDDGGSRHKREQGKPPRQGEDEMARYGQDRDGTTGLTWTLLL